jgi:hypothetical protein
LRRIPIGFRRKSDVPTGCPKPCGETSCPCEEIDRDRTGLRFSSVLLKAELAEGYQRALIALRADWRADETSVMNEVYMETMPKP